MPAGTTGPAADAIRQRASTLGAAPDYAPLPDLAAAAAGHRLAGRLVSVAASR